MDLVKTLKIAGAGMHAQVQRLRVIAENLANAQTVGGKDGSAPYRRKMVTFQNVLDRELGVKTVSVDRILYDRSEFERRYEPTHPAADKDGYVAYPNVKPLIEMMDMREAQRSYEANLGIIEVSKSMIEQTIQILRG